MLRPICRRGPSGSARSAARWHSTDKPSEPRLRRRLLAAYDVERQLERGYTLDFGQPGRLVRSVASLKPGDVLSTRFADGSARSSVQLIEPQQVGTQPEQPVEQGWCATGEAT